ncbi:MAG: A24 family peptidase [Methanobacteriaceae archaeon]|nr:A24 family peptidase [Methanobacteriaceae archaeon]
MNLEIILILLSIITCIISTITDIKQEIIPNTLTFSMIIIGLIITTVNYIINNNLNINYYLFIILTFTFSYILWYLNVWAGGDVKLFTALACLLPPEIQNMVIYNIMGITIPIHNFIPLPITLILNSILLILPLLLLMITRTIFKKYTKKQILKITINKEILINTTKLSIVILLINLISQYILIDHILIKITLLFLLTIIINKLLKNNRITYTLIIPIILYSILTSKIIEISIIYCLCLMIKSIKIVFKNNIIKETLTTKQPINKLEEGMILRKPIKKDNQIIIKPQSHGLTKKEIQKIQQLKQTPKTILIQKSISFAPIILLGLITTITIGNLTLIINNLLQTIIL